MKYLWICNSYECGNKNYECGNNLLQWIFIVKHKFSNEHTVAPLTLLWVHVPIIHKSYQKDMSLVGLWSYILYSQWWQPFSRKKNPLHSTVGFMAFLMSAEGFTAFLTSAVGFTELLTPPAAKINENLNHFEIKNVSMY